MFATSNRTIWFLYSGGPLFTHTASSDYPETNQVAQGAQRRRDHLPSFRKSRLRSCKYFPVAPRRWEDYYGQSRGHRTWLNQTHGPFVFSCDPASAIPKWSPVAPLVLPPVQQPQILNICWSPHGSGKISCTDERPLHIFSTSVWACVGFPPIRQARVLNILRSRRASDKNCGGQRCGHCTYFRHTHWP